MGLPTWPKALHPQQNKEPRHVEVSSSHLHHFVIRVQRVECQFRRRRQTSHCVWSVHDACAGLETLGYSSWVMEAQLPAVATAPANDNRMIAE